MSDLRISKRFFEVVGEAEHLLALSLELGLIDARRLRLSSTSMVNSVFGGSSVRTSSLVRRLISGAIRRRRVARSSGALPLSIGTR
ncbi:MAG: hypothetical protein R2789_13420 [Microthrixaceae bacterium]